MSEDPRPTEPPAPRRDTTGQGEGPEHKVIYLQPWCDSCARLTWAEEGRQWCEDDVWDPCDECGRKSVAYRLSAP